MLRMRNEMRRGDWVAALTATCRGYARPGVFEWLQPAEAPTCSPTRVVSLAPASPRPSSSRAGKGRVGVTPLRRLAAEPVSTRGRVLYPTSRRSWRSNPDVVLCERNSGIKNVVEKLASLGVRVGVANTPDIPSVVAMMEDVGALMGKRRRGKRVAAQMRSRLEEHKTQGVRRPRGKPSSFTTSHLRWPPGTDHLRTVAYPRRTLNLAGYSPVRYPVYDVEKLLRLTRTSSSISRRRPWTPPTFKRLLADTDEMEFGCARCQQKRCTRSRRVPVPPGPRIVDAIDKLARILHPEAFNKN